MDLDKIMKSKSDEELGAEVSDLKHQMEAMQKTLKDMKYNSVSNNSENADRPKTKDSKAKDSETKDSSITDSKNESDLLEQIREFRSQTGKQQEESQQQLEHSLNEAMHALNKIHSELESNKVLSQMSSLIEQAERQLDNMNHHTQN